LFFQNRGSPAIIIVHASTRNYPIVKNNRFYLPGMILKRLIALNVFAGFLLIIPSENCESESNDIRAGLYMSASRQMFNSHGSSKLGKIILRYVNVWENTSTKNVSFRYVTVHAVST